MKTFALKTRKGSVVKMMSSKSAKQQKALEQARSKLEDLTRKDVVSFSFILSEEGVDHRHDELVRGVWDDRGGPEDSNARSSPPSPKHKADQNREASRRL